MGAAGGDGGGEVGGDEGNLRDMADLSTRLKVGEAASLQKCPEVDETEIRYIQKKCKKRS